ncbi:MAG: crossover junction endodeoxyribonuclease RuvC [Oscillospiraceae bacterium]
MIILGVDPGYAIVGWGVVRYDGNKFETIAYGAVTTAAGTPFPIRLQIIYDGMQDILQKYKPNAMSIEKLFFTNNQKTGIDVAQARGVILLTAQQAGVEIAEYTPLQVKQAVTGYGKAEKNQIMEMTKILLSLKQVPKPDDTADALAMAICHGHCSGSRLYNLKR